MGDRRFARHYKHVSMATDKAATLRAMRLDEIVAALAEASRHSDAYLANILATEAQNRIRQKQHLLASVPEALLAVDSTLHITYVNDRAAEDLRLLRGAPMPEGALRDLLERAIRERARVEATTREGARTYALSAAPIQDEGEVAGATLVARDVTTTPA